MKREFLNQEDTANKFWHVEQKDAQLHVHYGRVGTAGQQQTKQFASAEAAAREAEKLVREKLRKGYVEQAPGAAVPAKQPNPIVQALAHHLRLGLHPRADILETVSTDVDDGNLNTDGFNGYDFLESKFEGDEYRFGRWLRQQLAEQLKRQRAREASYPARTDFDRLAAAFAALNQQHVVAIHGATDTRSGGEEMAWSARAADSAGFCFYHTQHLRDFDAPQQLHLYFGSYNDSEAAAQAIGRRVVAALQAQDLAVEWDDSPDTAIQLPALNWQKRFDDQDWPRLHLAEEAAIGSATIAGAVAALRKFVRTMEAHPDVYMSASFPEPAPAELLAPYRANPQLLPAELLDFYALMNGCELEWGYQDDLESDNYEEITPARLNIPPLTPNPGFRDIRFGSDLENEYTFFGPGTVSIFFDQMQPEYGSWLVAYGPGGLHIPDSGDYHPLDKPDPVAEAATYASLDPDRMMPVYLYSKNETQPLPGTLADYLLAGIAHGFVYDWPMVAGKSRYEDEDALERVARYRALLEA